MENRKNGWSILGFGCMRFPRRGGSVDMEETERELAYAIDQGINYFDTAYIYPGNEKILGTLVERNGWRQQITIATKMPHYLIKSMDGLEKLFQEQLSRLKTDYIDNYIMHMLPDAAIWEKLVNMGILAWIEEKKSVGQIRKIGFSYHGNTENFLKLLDVYPWEFCQVQYNYMDEHTQAGRVGVEKAAAMGIPVIIMEPLRGGRLVSSLPVKAQALFQEANTERTPAEWALRWLWDQPAVSVVLSGMNSMDMLKENIRVAQNVHAKELTEEDMALFTEVRDAINEKIKVSCTGCGYCQPCPAGVDIPGIFRYYNMRYTDNWYTGMKEYFMNTTLRVHPTNASRCIGCGKCEKHCPQSIAIREELKNVVRVMEGPVYKIAAVVARGIFKK